MGEALLVELRDFGVHVHQVVRVGPEHFAQVDHAPDADRSVRIAARLLDRQVVERVGAFRFATAFPGRMPRASESPPMPPPTIKILVPRFSEQILIFIKTSVYRSSRFRQSL
jgi:hypothetical protein